MMGQALTVVAKSTLARVAIVLVTLRGATKELTFVFKRLLNDLNSRLLWKI